jgi:predicted SnoaL-like aldol condensation-catalyzing enzyme
MFKYTKIHKVLGEGNFVLTVSEGEWNGGKKQAFYDLFRMKEGKIVEHWDVIQEIPTEGLAHNNGMFGFKN